MNQPFVIWLTGLSGSGKTTIAKILKDKLEIMGKTVEILDGDIIRRMFPHTGYDEQSRMDHIMKVGFIAGLLEKHNVCSIVSLISPYTEARNFARMQCKNFIEVYLSTPIEICEERDVKGLYSMARSGEITNFTGIGAPYEVPVNPDINLDTSTESEYTSARRVYSLLEKRELVH